MSYVINLDEYETIRTHLIALYVNGDKVTYFDRLEVEYIPKETKRLIDNKEITTSINITQENHSINCGYFWIGFINFMLKGKPLLDYDSLFFSDKNEKNDKMIYNTFNNSKQKFIL